MKLIRDIGFMYVCANCAQIYNLEGKISKGNEACVLCKSEKKVMEVRATYPENYTPREWITTIHPEGEPWWMTGRLISLRS